MRTLLIAALFTFAPALASADEAPHGAPPIEKPAEGGHEAAHHGHHDPSKHFRFLGSPVDHYGKDVTGGPLGDGIQKDEHGNDVRGEEEPMSAPFIFMVLNFAILLGILVWKGKPAAQKLAADRHDQIKSALDEAAKLRKEAADKLAEYETKLKAADAEINALVAGIRADAEAEKARILESADRQAAQMKRDAEQRIAAEIETARAVLTREVTIAATSAAETILRQKMTAGDHQKTVATFIGGIQKEAR
jgi:F-type H+-transporting ATPase subunit b